MQLETRQMIGRQLIRLLILVAAGAWVGSWFDAAGFGLATALSGFLVWHFAQFVKLYDWLLGGRRKKVPDAPEPWYRVFDAMHRWRKDTWRDRKKLLSVIEEFRTSTEALADAVLILSPDDHILWANSAAGKLLGIDRRRDLGNRVTLLVRFPAFISYMRKGDFSESLELKLPGKDGPYLNLQVTPYLQGQKLVVVRDITRIKTLENIRRDFVANVSHELRTPLTVIRGYLELFQGQDGVKASISKDVLASMEQEAARMQRIVDELLYLAKLEKSEPIKASDVVNGVTMLEQVEEEARVLSQGRHRIDTEINAPGQLHMRHEDLFRVMVNLASNAVRYTPEGGSIRLRWRRVQGALCFEVEDTGIGIAAEDIPRVTERFYRTDSGRERVSGGTGLGLAIVKHTLERYGARLEIVSQPGQGSIFRAVFPESLLADPDGLQTENV